MVYSGYSYNGYYGSDRNNVFAYIRRMTSSECSESIDAMCSL